MNNYYKVFQEDNFNHYNTLQWREYGIRSFKNLMQYLGYPKDDALDSLRIDDFVYHEFMKGEVLQQAGAICERFYFILQGSVKITNQREGLDVIFALMDEGIWPVRISIFLKEHPQLIILKLAAR